MYLADPDGAFRGRLAGALREGGIEVVEFDSGAELEARALSEQPDLVLMASGSPAMQGRQVLARLKCRFTGRRYPLVFVTDRTQPIDRLARSVQGLLAEWNRLGVHNLVSVVTWLQTRGRSGQVELEALGTRGTIVLRGGEIEQASWKELRGREVLPFFAEEFPDAGFRFAEPIDAALAAIPPAAAGAHEIAASDGRSELPAASGVRHPPPRASVQAHLELARSLLERRRLADAFIQLRLAEHLSAPPDRVHTLLGLAHLRSGDLVPAIAELQLARRLNPADEEAASALREARAALARSAADRIRDEPDSGVPQAAGSPRDAAGDVVERDEKIGASDARADATDRRARASDTGVASAGTPTDPDSERSAASPPAPVLELPPELVPAPRRDPPTVTRALRRRGLTAEAAPALAAEPGPRTADALVLPALPMTATAGRLRHPSFFTEPPVSAPAVEPSPGAGLRVSEAGGGAGRPATTTPATSLSTEPRRRPVPSAAAAVAAAVVVAIGLGLATGVLPWPFEDAASPSTQGEVATSLPRVEHRRSPQAPAREQVATLPAAADVVPAARSAPATSTSPQSREPDAATQAEAALQPEGSASTGGGGRSAGVGAAAAPTLEQLRGEPRVAAVDRAPTPGRLLDGRGARVLIHRGSGQLELLREWTDEEATRRAATLWVLVAASGRVQEVRVLQSSGSGAFDRRAAESVGNVGYRPARRGRVAVPAWVRQRVVLRPG